MHNATIGGKQGFDAIVVGSGAGGCAAAYRLVRAGLKVLLIEKGLMLPRDHSTLDVGKVVHQGLFKSKERWLDGRGSPLVPEEYFNLGGKTKWYGAALARFSPAEFLQDDAHMCLGWPLAYVELEPYYEEAERVLGVREFPCERDLQTILTRLGRRNGGWRAVPLPMGLAGEIAEAPEEASHFDGFASVRQLKSDGESTFLRRIADAPNLEIVTGVAVDRLLPDAAEARTVVGVRLANGAEYRGREVLLAAGAMHSPRLLQRYLTINRLKDLPVANQVGRNFKLHLLTAVLAVSPSKKTDLLRKTTLILNDALPHSSVQPLGFDGELIATLVPRIVPRPIARQIGARAYGFFLQTEDGSDPANRIVDADSLTPAPRLDYDAGRIRPALDEHRRLVRRFMAALLRCGMLSFSQRIGLHGTAHACGSLAAGTNPENSAVDAIGRVHGLSGLRVVDGSVLPRSSRVNPALTIYAWSLRVADRLIADHALRQAS